MGTTACAIIDPIIKACPNIIITVFALAWTPTLKQQEYILQRQNKSMLLNEPEVKYGKAVKAWEDEDFESGATDVFFSAGLRKLR